MFDANSRVKKKLISNPMLKLMSIRSVYTLKKEYESEPETEQAPPKKMAALGPRKFEGIGPTTRDGIPVVLRSVSDLLILNHYLSNSCQNVA